MPFLAVKRFSFSLTPPPPPDWTGKMWRTICTLGEVSMLL